jgi:hypothetical protein
MIYFNRFFIIYIVLLKVHFSLRCEFLGSDIKRILSLFYIIGIRPVKMKLQYFLVTNKNSN